jgi:hypothetical protein
VRRRLRLALRLVTPWGIEWWLYVRRIRKAGAAAEAEILEATPAPGSRVEEAVRFLVGRGLDERSVRLGSIPERSLHYLGEIVPAHLPPGRPVRALHVGNFVGISLAYVSWLVRDHHPESLVVSVDPDVTHRKISHPQEHAVALLHHFGLLSTNLIVPGYTLERASGDGPAASDAEYRDRLACENVLENLGRAGSGPFDFVLLDGNHERDYLIRELGALRGLLAEGSIVVFDDIGEWAGVRDVFAEVLEGDDFVELGQDGRVGVLQLATGRPSRYRQIGQGLFAT